MTRGQLEEMCLRKNWTFKFLPDIPGEVGCVRIVTSSGELKARNPEHMGHLLEELGVDYNPLVAETKS